MWLMAIPAVIFAYPLRLFKRWKKRRNPYKMDGILEMDELIEFIRLHEKGEGCGGSLEDGAGRIVRMMMVQQEDVNHWKSVIVLYPSPQVSATTFQRHINPESEGDNILFPIAESSRGSSSGTARGLRRRTNRSSEAFSGNRNTIIEPSHTRNDSGAGRAVDQPPDEHEDLPLDEISANRASSTSSHQRLPVRLHQVDGPSIPQIDKSTFYDIADNLLQLKEESTSGQWVKALVRDLNTLASGQPALSPGNRHPHSSNWQNGRSGSRSASTGTIQESQNDIIRGSASFWTSGHIPQPRQSVYSYFNVDVRGIKGPQKAD